MQWNITLESVYELKYLTLKIILTYSEKTSIKSPLTKIRCTVAPPSGRDSSKCGDFLMRLEFQKRSALKFVSRIIP